MFSLIIIIILTITSLALQAAVLARIAKFAGSLNSRFLIALLLVTELTFYAIAIFILIEWMSTKESEGSRLLSFTPFVAMIAVSFILFKYRFQLNKKQTGMVVGGYFIVQIALTVVILLLIRPFVMESFFIPTDSMSPTLTKADHVAACKLFKPKRLDVVAYWTAPDSRNPKVAWCRRLIGLPGENLRFENGNIYVDEQKLVLPEHLNGKCHARDIQNRFVPYMYVDGQTIHLGSDEVFLIGDHLEASVDSRVTGPVKYNEIFGVIDLRFWPASRLGIIH